jgi:hypothetical protein
MEWRGGIGVEGRSRRVTAPIVVILSANAASLFAFLENPAGIW